MDLRAAGVVGLSFLLLLAAFRAPLIALKAGVMNLLSVGAAYGVLAAVAEGGFVGELIGISADTPVPVFIPVMMFAVLFGLSMDYEVFLLSRIREEYAKSGETSDAVVDGLAKTARVITAAAAIIVFTAFILSPESFLKLMGIGMASAILLDATVVRMVLVPAVMQPWAGRTGGSPAGSTGSCRALTSRRTARRRRRHAPDRRRQRRSTGFRCRRQSSSARRER